MQRIAASKKMEEGESRRRAVLLHSTALCTAKVLGQVCGKIICEGTFLLWGPVFFSLSSQEGEVCHTSYVSKENIKKSS